MAETRPGEFELIKQYFAPLADDPGSVGLTDDVAVFTPSDGFELVLTKDVLAADVHFFATDAPEAIAAKALRVNLSDLAAKGAHPRGYLLGLALPTGWTEDWLCRFSKGLAADQAAYDISLLGGDTIRSGNGLQVSITAIGEVPKGKTVRRSGASSGDRLFVTGTIGDAAAGLKARLDHGFAQVCGLDEQKEAHILSRYLLPRPRTRLSTAILSYASASMDVSDGLFADLGHMCRASHVDAAIDVSKVPVSPAVQSLRTVKSDLFFECLNGGDDYEILAAVPENKTEDFLRAARRVDCPVTDIGVIAEGKGLVHVEDDGKPVSEFGKTGFRHF